MKQNTLENRIKHLEKKNSDSKTILKLINQWIESPVIFQNLKFIGFIAILILFYIFHTRNAEILCSKISYVKEENQQLRWEYLFKKSKAEKFERKEKLNDLLNKRDIIIDNTYDLPQKLKQE